jgi:urate oxidase
VLDLLKRDAPPAYDHYEAMLSQDGQQGLARELARMNLPMNIYTQWYWKTDLHNLFHFLRLRADAHAQYEIRVYAEAIAACRARLGAPGLRRLRGLPHGRRDAVVAQRLLDLYEQVDAVDVTALETRWSRLPVGGAPHGHSFVLDGNGKPLTQVMATRAGMQTTSGISDFTFMKCTQSGWSDFLKDPMTTLPETDDRIAATSMEARWRWQSAPADWEAANATILASMLEVFATTYSHSVQDSLYRMGRAALAAVPELRDISMACPNKHYLLVNLAPFGLDNDNAVFLPTDEPHGQIECTVGRD